MRLSSKFVLLSLIVLLTGRAYAAPRWDPARTRVFIVCLARFQGEKVPSFSTNDRNDTKFAEMFAARGVPRDQIALLLDDQANTANIKSKFQAFLARSKPNETLIFYFGSHGGYDAKTGKWWFVTFDGSLPFEWAFDGIDQSFKGHDAMVFGDCCYSGALADLAKQRKSHIAYGVLSSAGCHNIAYSGWRFIDCLMRAFSGSPLVDMRGTGTIDFADLADYTAKRMAFIAEGRPTFVSTGNFDPHIILSQTAQGHRGGPIGSFVEVNVSGDWETAEVLDVAGGKYHVHGTAQQSTYDAWVTPQQTRAISWKHFADGARVSVESDGKWYPAVVIGRFETLHLIHYDGYTAAYDEWVGPSRIR